MESTVDKYEERIKEYIYIFTLWSSDGHKYIDTEAEQ